MTKAVAGSFTIFFFLPPGILLHFEDPGIYVLDPQWLAKLASAVNPEFLNECSSIQNGTCGDVN